MLLENSLPDIFTSPSSKAKQGLPFQAPFKIVICFRTSQFRDPAANEPGEIVAYRKLKDTTQMGNRAAEMHTESGKGD